MSADAPVQTLTEGVHNIKNQAEWDKIRAEHKDDVIVVDFFATWCGPCKVIAPHVVKFSNDDFPKAIFLKVDVDEVPSVAEKEGIKAMPTFKIYHKKDDAVAEVVGAMPPALKAKIDSVYKDAY